MLIERRRPIRIGVRCRGAMKRHGLLLALIGCTHAEAPPIVAPASLDVTMDPSDGGVILEDDERRHTAPAGIMRRRIYAVEHRFVRWYPPTRRQTGRWWHPPMLPRYPEDRVALRGGPTPTPGQRFVLFDDTGPRGVVEATGERCPPGHEDCVACAADDPERLHWARIVGAVPDHADGLTLALGPFDPDEALPAARDLWQMDARRVGRWELEPETDLDGDGAADVVRASTRGQDGRWLMETWRLYKGRLYTEPHQPLPALPMHVLQLDPFGPYDLGDGWVGVWGSGLDGFAPTPGEYRIVGHPGEVGRVSLPEREERSCFAYDGPPCHPARWTSSRPRKLRGPTVVLSPPRSECARPRLHSRGGPCGSGSRTGPSPRWRSNSWTADAGQSPGDRARRSAAIKPTTAGVMRRRRMARALRGDGCRRSSRS